MDHRVGHRQVQSDATGFQADQEHRHFAVLEALHQFFAMTRGTGQHQVADLGGVERLGDQFQHFGELRKHQHVAAFVGEAAQHRQQQIELGRLRHAPRTVELDQARVAADLA